VPVLATPDVGMAEIVREVTAGVVVDPSPAGIASGLKLLLGDAVASRAMGEAGRSHVMAHYSWHAVARRMEDLYRSVLASSGARGTVK
jgi:glycosyltransferase involved in cell wall biosynthesis